MQPNTVKTLFGHNINDGTNYRAVIMNAGALPDASNVWIEEQSADSVDSGAFTVSLRNPLVMIEILNYSNRDALGEQLKMWCKRGLRGTLVTTFKDDGYDYLLNCSAVNIVQDAQYAQIYVAQLESGDTDWRAVVADTDTWSPTGTGGTKTITVAGGDETRLIASLTATTNPTIGYLYQNLYRLVDMPGVNLGMRAWCLIVDTATLYAAGKIQIDCDDLRIVLDGKETKRWIADPNTTTTNIWFNMTLGPGYSLILDTAIGATGDIATMTFNKTASNMKALSALPNKGVLYDGTEWISWNGKTLSKYQLMGIRRGVFGTTLQSHTTGSTLRYIQHTIVMKYGNVAATAPALDDENYDDDKPIFDLSISDNTKWIYTASTKFYDPDFPNKTGSWTPVLNVLGTDSNYYWIKQDAESGNPAIGSKLACWLKSGVNQTEAGRAGWMLKCAAGFYRVTMTGSKYRSTTRWPAFAGLQRSIDGNTWLNVWVDATPTAAGAWQALASHSAVSINTTNKYLFFGLNGTIKVLTNAYAMLEGLTATIEFYTANLPTGTFLGNTESFGLDLAFENQTMGDIVYLDYPMLKTKTFLLDSENYDVTVDGQNMHDAMSLDDEGRSIWMRLAKGSNVLAITSPDCGMLDIALSWYRRRL